MAEAGETAAASDRCYFGIPKVFWYKLAEQSPLVIFMSIALWWMANQFTGNLTALRLSIEANTAAKSAVDQRLSDTLTDLKYEVRASRNSREAVK